MCWVTEFRLPDLGEGVTEGEVVEWRVAPGAEVRRDQVLCVVATDKATVEIPAPLAGRVAQILVPAGAAVKVGDPLLTVDQGESPGVEGPPRQPPAAVEPPVAETVRPFEFRLPDLGEGVSEGEVLEWRVGPGSEVARDQVLCVLATDKASVEIPSPVSGRVAELMARVGEAVKVGEPLVRVAADASASPRPPAPEPASAPGVPGPRPDRGASVAAPSAPRVPALPSVRRAARSLGIDLGAVTGTGPGGRVRMSDLRPRQRREPLRGALRVMAERLAEAHRRVPQVTVALDVDFAPSEELVRTASSDSASILGLVCLGAREQVREQPIFNTSLDDAAMEVVYHDQLQLGIAVQTAGGLKVATVRDALALSPSGLQAEIERLVTGARQGTLRAPELTGSTFTISSGGRLGGLFATPIVNWPNVATLGVHEIQDRPVVRQGQVLAGRCAVLSLSFDHRVVDGMTASAFLYGLAARLADPERLLRSS